MTNEVIPGIEPSDLPENILVFNGVNGSTGDYGISPMTELELAKLIRGDEDPELLAEQREKMEFGYPVKEGLDPSDLSTVGWGLVLPMNADPAIKEALSPLLELRKKQAGGSYEEGGLFKIFEGPGGYQPGDSKRKFVSRHGGGTGVVDPKKGVPFYLLLVGSPAEIPFRFQFQLDVQFAVGRLYFETLQEYANYAANVVAVEQGEVNLSRSATFFGVENNHDRATQMSSKYQVRPLLETVQKDFSDWTFNSYLGKEATKDNLTKLLGGPETPAFLFTASHGMEFKLDDSRQLPHQGAILCQDWPGPRRHRKPIPQDFYFAGDDLTEEANLLGMVMFAFACFGAGCPLRDEFAYGKKRPQIAPKPFIAGLPTRMLGKKNGALAVVGHVERAWGYSFMEGSNANITTFESSLIGLLDINDRLGFAMEDFDLRFAELATGLTAELEEIDIYKHDFPDKYQAYLAGKSRELASMWTEHNDARSYVILGDPAAQLPLADEAATRPSIESLTIAGKPKSAISPTKAVAATDDPPDSTMEAQAESFGLKEWITGENEGDESQILQPLRASIAQLGRILADAVDDLGSLEVRTYTTDDMGRDATYNSETKEFGGGAKLQAMTRIDFDGDIKNLVPRKQIADSGTEIDEALWQTHKDMVELAQLNRTEFIKALGAVAAQFFKR